MHVHLVCEVITVLAMQLRSLSFLSSQEERQQPLSLGTQHHPVDSVSPL